MVVVLDVLDRRYYFHLDHYVEHADRHHGEHIRLRHRKESILRDEEPALDYERILRHHQ